MGLVRSQAGSQGVFAAGVVHVPAQVTAQTYKPAQMLRPQFVLFGDSITQKASDPQGGWAAALAHNYQRKARAVLSTSCRSTWHFDTCQQSDQSRACEQVDVVNRGYSGYNTRWAKYLLEKVFPANQPKVNLVTLFWGANDASLPDRNRCVFGYVSYNQRL